MSELLKKSNTYLSIVTPVYGDRRNVLELYRRLVHVCEKITDSFEIVMVNDACPFGSGEEIAKIAMRDKRVKFIDFSRNFGQHKAITAGLDYADGDYVVVMDCDLQDPPEAIPLLLKTIKERNADVVFTDRGRRKEAKRRIFFSKAFRFCYNLMVDPALISERNCGNFSIITKKVVKEFRRMHENMRGYGGLISWLGFPIEYVNVEAQKRFAGRTSYNFIKSMKLAISSILQQSVKPLFVSATFSIIFFVISCVFAGLIVYNHFSGRYSVDGWAGIMCAITFISSLIFLTLAVMSLYIANIFEAQKGRPLYVISRTMNIDEGK